MGAKDRAICRVRSDCTCSTTCASARSVEFETLGAHECTEIGAFGHRILPGFVLRPAVVGALAEPVGVALTFIGLHGLAPPIVGGDLFLEPRIVVAVVM